MDPESGFDAPANVALRDAVIVAVGDDRPEAREVLDASGLVVAPGFVDLHAHGQDPESQRYQARDGVTTAMELEIGAYPVDAWYAGRSGRALINYGATVSHQGARRGSVRRRADGAERRGHVHLGARRRLPLRRGFRGGAAPPRPAHGGGSRPGRPRLRVRHHLYPGSHPRGALVPVRSGGGTPGAGVHPPPIDRRVRQPRGHRPVPGSHRQRRRHRRRPAHRPHEQQRRRVRPGRPRADPGRAGARGRRDHRGLSVHRQRQPHRVGPVRRLGRAGPPKTMPACSGSRPASA